MNHSTRPPHKPTPGLALDHLSDSALRLLFIARKDGMAWAHEVALSGGPLRELQEAGIVRAGPLLVRPLRWRWEERP